MKNLKATSVSFRAAFYKGCGQNLSRLDFRETHPMSRRWDGGRLGVDSGEQLRLKI